MALVLEDGTNVPGANSYLTVADIREYAAARGLCLPADDADIEPLAVLATDWLETYRDRYQGAKAEPSSSLQWPRYGVVIDGYFVQPDEIPIQLKHAQAQAAIDAQEAPLTMRASAGIKREKVDVIEVEYFEGAVETKTGGSAVAEKIIQPLLRAYGMGVRVVRV